MTKASVLEYLNEYLKNGQGLLLCSATVGPLIYIIIKDDENNRAFPGKSNYVISIFVICIVSAAILGLKTSIQDSSNSVISSDAVWFLSALISVASLLIWFLITGTKSAREQGAPLIMRTGEAEFVKKFQAQQDE